ncbi:MAG TPA: protein kinase [Polyangiaceae bacterium]|nr:protein kinase [Polyangiaceae bacterium]
MDSSVPYPIPVITEGTNPSLPPPRGTAAHYKFIGMLGRGGMAEVHEVEDLRTGRHVAMKRLLPQDDAERRAKARKLFEREYQTLSQLSHPRIVQVYDFSIDDVGPYYTMELLSGGDLSQLVPMDWRRACRIGKDICSALSLLHSRSMVHRDLSPRNVRCTEDGLAKLIDFGAMAPMGRSKVGIVGTPAYCAPEVVNGQLLDARTDLYALGASLYYGLTGRHAYPAKDFASLPERWQFACPEPSEYVPDVPKALDALILELLRLDPLARPTSAFEVIARLCAIDGTAFDEQLVVAHAYLSTPVLVGRSAALAAVQRKIHRADKRRGRAVAVTGSSGVGRTRFIEAVALEAKLRGATVVSADAQDGREGDYGVVRALARRLVSESKERALAALGDLSPVIGQVVPEICAAAGGAEAAPRAVVQQSIRDWFLRFSDGGSLVLLVDDFHAIDEPSAATLALLAHDVRERRVLVVASMDSGRSQNPTGAMKLFADEADSLALAPLAKNEADELFRSIFGDGPDVGLLAHRLHEISGGNPRDLMELAQHLVDRKTIRYERGAWSVPGSFDAADLPSTMAQALELRAAALSDGAREVGAALSLTSDQTVTTEEVALLLEQDGAASAASVLDELLRAHVVRSTGDRLGLSQEGWATAFQKNLTDEARRRLHRKLARLYAARKTQEFRHGMHLLRAGDVELALDVLVAHAALSQEQTGNNAELFFQYVQALPPDWLAVYDEAIRLCEETGRPRKHGYVLRGRLGGLLGLLGQRDVVHLFALVRELADVCGLTAYHAMDPSLDPGARLKAALAGAQRRYAESSERDRILDPKTAIVHFARAVTQIAGVITAGLDYTQLKRLPRVAPFAALSPAFGVVQMLLDGMASRYAGRLEDTRQIYLDMMARLGASDGGGLDHSHNEYTRLGVMNGIAMLEAGMGLATTLDWSAKLDGSAMSRVNGVQTRMLYELWQGNTVEADHLRHQVELIRIQQSPLSMFEGSHLLWQITAHGLAEDLTHLRRTLDEIAVLAARHPAWVPVQHYGKGEYHRAGGAYEAALGELETALSLVGAGDHQIWPYLAGAHVRVLDELGRLPQALAAGEKYLADAEEARLGYVTSYICMPLAVVHAKSRQKDTAVALADRAIAQFVALGATGLNLGLAYEARARVALLLAQKQEYLQFLGLCRDVYTTRKNPALVTKFEKLRRSGAARKPAAEAPRGGGFFTSVSVVGTSRLDLCSGPESRASCALTMVMDQCGASAGVLYLVGAHGPFAAASSGEADDVLRSLALEYLQNEASDVATTGDGSSLTTGDSQIDWTGSQGEKYRPVLLTHESSDGFLVTGVAVVAMSPDTPFSYPSRVANEVSRHLRKMGDVTGIVVAG